ncbi:sensor histidine kinase [Hymenobacter metallilatus]|uniref:Histidine kinase n=1 Tax=Hymenobacter metallilatus TaxID=2493666 RepID=A0A3R9MNV9_9BACT|nr:sensor histidine kinase [Hymenobacter metallilatus]RSK37113.1 histidine kinase [Hymenobacter metallilatus]
MPFQNPSRPLSRRVRPAWPLPAWLRRLPWVHLGWFALLLYFDAQGWLLNQGVLVPPLKNHFWPLALTTDALDSGLFYLNWLTMPALLRRGRLGAYVLVLALGLGVFCAARIGVSYYFEEVKIRGQMQPLGFYVQVLQSYYLLLGGLILLLSFFLRLAGDYLREQGHRRELEQQHLRTELALLKNQLHPHFLFNTLNNIYSLTLHASPQAPEAVLRLSELLRYQLYDSQDDLVPLAREIHHLQSFLTLQHLRLPPEEADEAIQFTVLLPPGADHACQLPPMLLLPLVENAFKHGDLTVRPHAVRLKLELTPEGQLQFLVRNRVAPEAASPGGVGLVNLRRRLELLYPERHALVITANAQEYAVRLSVQVSSPVS